MSLDDDGDRSRFHSDSALFYPSCKNSRSKQVEDYFGDFVMRIFARMLPLGHCRNTEIVSIVHSNHLQTTAPTND
jgi:hypothetical protein